ncbi:hypothetical protein Snoj_35140 [Streptomyces nojiriensis]|uniref:Uncharacterized protein n=1 Tax=Streptomyces nojiriensis TaxID=66374 RepID=A0ABQ3SN80_9ACTN|nr:hypothetical protein GCM10010205_72280 [Streptomyces nojiriensis]GHI69596.1 hypothetical protein Snoj_35140 [Streptomyces nojiriensis]
MPGTACGRAPRPAGGDAAGSGRAPPSAQTAADYSRPPVIQIRDIASARAGYRAASQSISESTSIP